MCVCARVLLQADNWLLSRTGSLSLTDFGGGLLLRDAPPLDFAGSGDVPKAVDSGTVPSPSTPADWEPMLFNSKELARCCNSMAWDPHVYRLSLSGPWVNGKRLRCHLEDVYAKSDLFAVGRMAYDALLSEAESKAFPSASVPKPTYEDDEVLTSTYCFGGVSTGAARTGHARRVCHC